MSDNAKGGIQLFARDRGTLLKLMDSNGREQTLKQVMANRAIQLDTTVKAE